MSDCWVSATLSHLFTQANVSATVVDRELGDYATTLPKILARMQGDLQKIPPAQRQIIESKLKEGAFTIILGIIEPTGRMQTPDKKAVLNTLPYVSTHQLHDIITNIESKGFPVKLSIIPRTAAAAAAAITATVSTSSSAMSQGPSGGAPKSQSTVPSVMSFFQKSTASSLQGSVSGASSAISQKSTVSKRARPAPPQASRKKSHVASDDGEDS